VPRQATIQATALYFTRTFTELLLKELDNTRPLSVIMANRISALREWAEGRTVSAD